VFWLNIAIILSSYSFPNENRKDIDEIFYCYFFCSSHLIVDRLLKSIKRSCTNLACALLPPPPFPMDPSTIPAKKKILDAIREKKTALLDFFPPSSKSDLHHFLCTLLPGRKACNSAQAWAPLARIIKFPVVSIKWSSDPKKRSFNFIGFFLLAMLISHGS